MTNSLKNQILIDGLEYCNWNRDILEDLWKGGITAVHATLVYWENTEESFNKIKECRIINFVTRSFSSRDNKNIGLWTRIKIKIGQHVGENQEE